MNGLLKGFIAKASCFSASLSASWRAAAHAWLANFRLETYNSFAVGQCSKAVDEVQAPHWKATLMEKRGDQARTPAAAPVRRLIVGISGATGAVYGIRLLQVLREQPNVESHLIITKAAERTIEFETKMTLREVRSLADVTYNIADIGAAPSSGSFQTEGMIVAPCSIKSLAAVATSMSTDLLSRSADVTLKERRRLVLMVRESPLHLGHLRLMVQAAEIGAMIVPPVPAFYNFPQTLDDIVNHTVGRVLDLFHLDAKIVRRWEGMSDPRKSKAKK